MTQTGTTVLDEIRSHISREFLMGLSNQGLADDENFIEAGIVDSYGLIEIVTFIETRFDIQLSDDDLVSPELTCIKGLSDLVVERTK